MAVHYKPSEVWSEHRAIGKDFRPAQTVALANHCNMMSSRFDVSLVTVSRQIWHEAQDAFFEVNTIRVRSLEEATHTYDHFKRLRHIEYAEEIGFSMCRRHQIFLWHILAKLPRFPRIQTATILCDDLRVRSIESNTVRNFIQREVEWEDVRCLALGVFEAKPPQPLNARIFLKYFIVTSLLPPARTLMRDHDWYDLFELSQAAGAENERTRTTAELLAATWLACYNRFRMLCAGEAHLSEEALEKVHEYEQVIFRGFAEEFLQSSPGVHWYHASLPDSVGLQDLNVREHGEELVEWASEMLTRNLDIVWHECDEPNSC